MKDNQQTSYTIIISRDVHTTLCEKKYIIQSQNGNKVKAFILKIVFLFKGETEHCTNFSYLKFLIQTYY